ncbi:hypothetical protein J2S75_000880 [Ancylobacter polymorphus]|uniref:DUF1674 domain-containing protein n=1 Tax=Ancylobacter polymorphus TaxID=223390 RepID=A0ABU0B7R0_9HYPH|nr:hypothetical protein [Ancylobacter polymorphus]
MSDTASDTVLTPARVGWFQWRMSQSDPTAPIGPTLHLTALTGQPEESAAPAPRRPLSPAAERALAEAEARRAAAAPVAGPREIDGRDGPEPVRYGDWEVKGIATDF